MSYELRLIKVYLIHAKTKIFVNTEITVK